MSSLSAEEDQTKFVFITFLIHSVAVASQRLWIFRGATGYHGEFYIKLQFGPFRFQIYFSHFGECMRSCDSRAKSFPRKSIKLKRKRTIIAHTTSATCEKKSNKFCFCILNDDRGCSRIQSTTNERIGNFWQKINF